MPGNKKPWELFLDGENKSITDLYNRYKDDLYLYGLKIIGDESLVKDAIQDVFIKMFNNRKKLLIGNSIRLYLLKSLRNKLFDVTRSLSVQNKKLQCFYNDKTEDKEISASVENEIIQEESRFQTQKKIKIIINSLSSKQKEIIFLKYTQDLSYDEISKILEIDKASVRTLLYRTLKVVKKRLDVVYITFPIFTLLLLYPFLTILNIFL